MIFITVALVIHFFVGAWGWVLFWIMLIGNIAMDHAKYSQCKKRHENLLNTHGNNYLSVLEKELEEKGLDALIDNSWLGLEPK